ncbi:MAG TPA: dienelactone hydrolase family protein, partial [Stellaceae bacterium]|nr:dienelactone hydrolase family protein [Stellaceae bacterium]
MSRLQPTLRGRVIARWVAIGSISLLISSGWAAAQVPGFNTDTVGGPASGKRAELYLPQGSAATAGVIVLHGCGGVVPHDRDWARRLAQWGYAALLIDSFRPRGYSEVCNSGQLVPPETQARDAFDGAAYLRSRTDLHIGRVGVIGFSHGGWAVLKAVLAGVARQPSEPAFAAAVALYPGCDPPQGALETDTLIFIGEADDWTPVARCRRWVDLAQPNGHALRIKTYPGALHAFDGLIPPQHLYGHYIGQDPAARADAIA